ncbi:zinc finger and SCAN domain-containing protein 4-like [Artibeus jamaicensis]|uniref:zinc finger and SCAN domain-containing protein 4-like n=1 Tax=Artibeus jamaicensis TaxID=9417 RepID=UPI00235ADEF0|nr:zinc finger and SCAN domain-containing protein 4-like [Artibeus jamaicensis]
MGNLPSSQSFRHPALSTQVFKNRILKVESLRNIARMDLDLSTSFFCESYEDDCKSENVDFIPSQRPALQQADGDPGFQNTQLSPFQNSTNLRARQELQQISESFHSWLQPEKHSKDEIIFQVVLEQFMINRHCSDRSMLKEKWEASGRNLETFMESLNDDCMRTPGLVHVHMQGQEALFSENMPLREVIVHLTKQLAAGTPTVANMGTPFWTAYSGYLQTGQGDEDKENGGNILKPTEVNDNITGEGLQIPPLLIIQGENYPGPGEGDDSLENPHSSRRVSLSPSRSDEGSPKGPRNQDVLMEVGPAFLSRLHQVTPEPDPTHQSNAGSSTCGVLQGRSRKAQRSHQCDKCPKIFRYFSRLKVHQRRHNNERTFICAVCNKGFVQASDLHVHQKIHTEEKPFRCSTCAWSFTHRTNLLAHERIHTGEKPYVCSVCQRCFRQSSTYHRHLRMHQRTIFRCVSSTFEASSG